MNATEPMATAVARMRKAGTDAVVVLFHEELAGIITEHDVARMVADGADPRRVLAGAYMTAAPFAVRSGETVEAMAQLMLDLEIRHLPVMRKGTVVGVVSAMDLLRHYVKHFGPR